MILLDTCVISEVLRPNPSDVVLDWLDGLPELNVYLPALVVGELQEGVELLPKGSKRTALRVWLEQMAERFSGRILAFDEETAKTWGSLTVRMERSGIKLPAVDSMLAALALHHSALLATRNITDYRDTGVEVINPWAEEDSLRGT